MSDGKIIAAVTIPAGILAVAILAVSRAGRTSPPVAANDPPPARAARPEPSGPSPAVAAAPPVAAPAPAPTPIPAPPAPAARPAVPATLPAEFASFRGLKWGDRIEGVAGMRPDKFQEKEAWVHLGENRDNIFIPNRHTRRYLRDADKLSFGPCRVSEIAYETFDGQFYRVSISGADVYELSTVFSGYYGQAKQERIVDIEFWEWQAESPGLSVKVRMSYNTSRSSSTATITCTTLERQLEAIQEREARELIAKGKKDF